MQKLDMEKRDMENSFILQQKIIHCIWKQEYYSKSQGKAEFEILDTKTNLNS